MGSWDGAPQIRPAVVAAAGAKREHQCERGDLELPAAALRLLQDLVTQQCPGRAERWPDRNPGRVCGQPRGWDQSEVSAPQTYAGVVSTLLAAAAKAELKGRLADQLQTALDSRGLIERAKGALMERERLDDQEAFTHLRRAARSSRRKLSEVAREVAAGQPLPRGLAHADPDRGAQQRR